MCPNSKLTEKRDRKSTGTTQISTGTITAIQRQQPTTEYRSVSLQRFPNFQQQKQLVSYQVPIGSHTVCCLQITKTRYTIHTVTIRFSNEMFQTIHPISHHN